MQTAVDHKDIPKLAANVPDWSLVARAMGFGVVEISEIEASNRTPLERTKAFLSKWIDKRGKGATFEELAKAVEDVGEHQQAADEIHKLAIKKARPPTADVFPQEDGWQMDKRSTNNPPVPQPLPRPKPDAIDFYEMTSKPRGVATIINNIHFKHMCDRPGTEKDAKDLQALFKSLGFHVTIHEDQTVQQMKSIVKNVAEKDHNSYSCLIVSVLSHGDEGKLYGIDSKEGSTDANNALLVEDLATCFDGAHCSSLIGKPKVFILQACRGSKTDYGVCTDGGGKEMDKQFEAEIEKKQRLQEWLKESEPDVQEDAGKLPTKSDILFAYSTVPGYYSYRNKVEGAWFIQNFIKMIEENKNDHLIDVLTKVNDMVATAEKPMKQMPCAVHCLRKKLYFWPQH